MRVNFSHGVVVSIAGNFHRRQLRPSKMVRQGHKRVPQTVDTDEGKFMLFTDGVDFFVDAVRVRCDDIALATFGQEFLQPRNHDRNLTGACGVFVFFLVNEISVLVENGSATDVDDTLLNVYVLPCQVEDLRAPERMKAQQGGNFASLAAYCLDEGLYLLWSKNGRSERICCGSVTLGGSIPAWRIADEIKPHAFFIVFGACSSRSMTFCHLTVSTI